MTAAEPIIAMGSTVRPAEPERLQWPELQPGEKVRLEVDATVGHPLGDDTMVFYVAHGDKTVSLYLPLDHPQVRVTRAEPADGVPQVGELWTDRLGARRLFAYYDEDDPVLLLMDEHGRSMPWESWHRSEAYGPIRRLMTVEQIASWQ